MLLWVLGEYSKFGRLANRYSMYYLVGLADPAECRQTDALRDRTLAEGQKKPTEKSKGTGRSSSFTECMRKRANKLTIDRTVRGLLAIGYRHNVQAQSKATQRRYQSAVARVRNPKFKYGVQMPTVQRTWRAQRCRAQAAAARWSGEPSRTQRAIWGSRDGPRNGLLPVL